MDPNAQAPIKQGPQMPQSADIPVVPISNQPLTLDPNLMSEPAVQSSSPVQSPPVQVVQKPIPAPQYPVGGPHKEAAPIMQAPVSEYVHPTEASPSIPQEVAEAGVEVVANSEQPQLNQEHKAVGIEHAKEAVPVVIPTQPTIQLPYTAAEVKQIEKKVPVSESKHWLAALTEYLLKKIGGVAV